MSAKRRTQRKAGTDSGQHGASRPGRKAAYGLRRAGSSNEWELVAPRCAEERTDDLEEVHDMIDSGELDVAIDELRWLLSGCPELLEAHQLLGELALADEDVALARGHFGYAYDLGQAAIPAAGWHGTLPYRLPGNRTFLTAAKGLALAFHQLGQAQRASEIIERLLALDPSDPLRVRPLLATWSAAAGEAPPAE